MLKNSARNWTLKESEMRLMRLFLKIEKSRFTRPGPINVLRPKLPRRLRHVLGSGTGCRVAGSVLMTLTQLAAMPGAAAGTAKHCVRIWLLGFPGLVRLRHPGPPTRFGTSIAGSVLRKPRASPPKVGVNGTPVLASNTPPSCQPPKEFLRTPELHLC